ncbi:MAG: OmpA family protein [Deltaproteobacteria bacterium]|nr:OmpA family protein [Deltaproteobacteria bacterium]
MSSVALGADSTRRSNEPFEFGLFAGALFMSKDHELYSGYITDQRPFKTAAPEFGLRLSLFPVSVLGIEAEGMLAPASAKNGRAAMIWGVRGHAILQLPLGDIVPMLEAGGGVLGVSSKLGEVVGSDQDPELHWGLGLKYFFADGLALRIDGRHVLAPAHDTVEGEDTVTSHFEALLGVSLAFGRDKSDHDGDGIIGADDLCPAVSGLPPDGCPPPDRDRDGVSDADDQCPDEAGPAPTGCPVRDSDGDGVADGDDACPQEAGSPPDGCPKDTDGDGIPDSIDQCPRESEDMDGASDEDGCPDLDNDSDGVVDTSDRCPMEAGPIENRGCPDTDTDGDGIVDRLDNCPTEAGTEANRGCARRQLVVIHREKLEILDRVYFETGRAVIMRRSHALLDNLAKVIVAHPDITKIRVEGHTDSAGSEDTNQKLSQKRAESVRAYLESKGVESTRLEAVGYGEAQPISTNRTAAGRAANRRVEFTIIDESVAPTPASNQTSVP